MPNSIFWNICGLNNWEKIIIDQHNTLLKSGLLDEATNVFINFTCNKKIFSQINLLLNLNKKYQLVLTNHNYKEYERPFLHYLLEWSKLNHNHNILYIHSKGVSHPNNKNVWLWRQLLEHVLITNYKLCLSKLDHYDAVGCNIANVGKPDNLIGENHKKHFSGNFWWSKTEYTQTLPKIRPDYKDLSIDGRYWLCERWVMVHYPKNKFYEICRTPYMRYYRRKPPNLNQIRISV